MTTYDGPATATADGTEYEVTAHLILTSDGHLTEWHGSLEAHSEEAAWAIYNADTSGLRIGAGHEGSFISVGHSAGSSELAIQGSGLPPFGS